MIYLCYFLFGFLFVRLTVAFVNYLSFSFLPKTDTVSEAPSVSVLIPARNEEKNIGILVEQLSHSEYAPFEIIVYNDHSEDETKSIVEQLASRMPNLKLLDGQELPKGWLGKNHACHQLSKAASGSILLFLDADVRVQKDLIDRSISHFQKYELQLLSIFPKQLMSTFGEKVSVPLMNWVLLSLLPLSLIRRSKNKAFSAANGQFMMFNAATYKSIWPHKECKAAKVEDIAILQLFKQKGLASETLLGDKDISCRMYDGLKPALDGFAKNIFQFFGNSVVATISFGVLTTIAPFIIYAKMGLWSCAAYVLGVLSIRLFVSLASRQSVIQNLILAFPQHIVFLVLILKGLVTKKQRKLLWKGRNILQD